MSERVFDVDQTKNMFARFPNRGEVNTVNVPLVLDAWENRDVFGYHNHRNLVSRPRKRESLKPQDWNPRLYHNWFDVYQEDLRTIGFDSITEFLLTGYVLNMEKFENIAGKIASVDSLIVKQIKEHVLPDKPGDFVRAYLKGELDGVIKYPDDPKTQEELAEKINVSQTWVSNLITGRFPTRIGFFVGLVRGMNLSPNLTMAVMEKYARYPGFAVKSEDLAVLNLMEERKFDTWQAELRILNKSYLQEDGFACVEEFLYARFCNTMERASCLLDQLDLLPQTYSPEQVKQSIFVAADIPSLKVLNKFDDGDCRLYLDAWAARGLYRINWICDPTEVVGFPL